MEVKTAIEIMLDKVDYKPVNPPGVIDELPYVTHEGVLTIGNYSLKVMVLNTGQRIISEDDLKLFLGE